MNVGVKRKIFLFGKISNNRLFLEISEFAATDYLPYQSILIYLRDSKKLQMSKSFRKVDLF